MKKSLLDSFKNIYLHMNNLSSYKSYYDALTLWVKENSKYYSNKLQSQTRLRMLLDLDLEKYLINNPGISLHLEKNRISKMDLSSIDEILMIICDTLWDMVTIRSDKICLNCGDGDLRYLKINTNDSDNSKVILECNICGKAVNIDGCECKDEIENYYPACKEDIQEFFRRNIKRQGRQM